MTLKWFNIKWTRRMSIALLLAVSVLLFTPVAALFLGGEILNINYIGSGGSQRIDLDGDGNSFSIAIYEAARGNAINLLGIVPIAMAVGILIGVLVAFTSRNPVAGLIAAVVGTVGVVIINLFIQMLANSL